MSKMNELLALRQKGDKLASKAEKHARSAFSLAECRKRPGSMLAAIDTLSRGYSRDEDALEALSEVLNEMKHDILRLAELRLAAKERDCKIKAAQCRAVLEASILPLPEEATKEDGAQ